MAKQPKKLTRSQKILHAELLAGRGYHLRHMADIRALEAHGLVTINHDEITVHQPPETTVASEDSLKKLEEKFK